jgi:signal transduction histidine kinase
VENGQRHGGGVCQVVVERELGAVRVHVDDDGPGIDEQDRARIFDRFYRADRARPRGGAGLGLALVRSIVELHGGGIAADSLTPHGTRFAVHLPL